eukprot:3681513-Prymnesium_polylepis.1
MPQCGVCLALLALADAVVLGKSGTPGTPVTTGTPAAPLKQQDGAPLKPQHDEVENVLSQLRSGLTKQVQGALEKQGSSMTIMVVGETGVGKTSL